MNLRENSFSAKLYKTVWLELPSNLCSYFWNYVLLILSLPISVLGIILRVFLKTRNASSFQVGGITYVCLFLLFIGGQAVEAMFWDAPKDVFLYFDFWVYLLLGIPFYLALVLAILTIILIVSLFNNNAARDIWETDKAPLNIGNTVVAEKYKAFKGKYCPKINWD